MKLAFSLAAAVLLLNVGCSRTSAPIASSPAENVQVFKLEQLHAVSADSLREFFDSNEVKALRVFGETPVIVVGEIDRITAREAGPDVHLIGGDHKTITCEFAPADSVAVEALAKGQVAAIAGIPFRSTFGLGLKRCSIVPKGITPAPGGFVEFREFEVAALEPLLEIVTQTRDSATRIAEMQQTGENISRKVSLEDRVSRLAERLAKAQRELAAARSERNAK